MERSFALNPKITTEVSDEVTNQYVVELTQKLNTTVAEINETAKSDPEHPHSFKLRFVEIHIKFFQNRGRIQIGYRFFASLRAPNYKTVHLDERGRYFFSSLYLSGVDPEGEVCTLETGVLNWLRIGCHHRYRDLLARYAYTLGIPSSPLIGKPIPCKW